MRRGSLLVSALAVPFGVWIHPTVAQQGPTSPPTPTKAERIADRALGNLLAWKVAAAKNVLDANQAELGATPEYKTALGLLRATEGNADEGVALLQQAAKAKPSDPAPQFFLGNVLYWQKKYDDANSAWKTARDRAKPLVDANPADSRAQYYAGASQVRLKQFGPARKALEAARDAGFDPALVDFQLGFSYALEEKWQDAANAFDAVATSDPKFAHVYFYRGLALRRPYVRGYYYNLQTLHPLKYVWIDTGAERTAPAP